MVEKREAVKRECACRGAIRLPDEQSEEPCEARSQGRAGARCSEFLKQNKTNQKHNHTDQTRKETKHEQDQDDQGVQGRHRRRL